MTGAKPRPENSSRAQSKVEASKPEKVSGSASGRRAPPAMAAGSEPSRRAMPARETECRGRRSAAIKAWRSRGAAIPVPIPEGRGNRAEAARGMSALVRVSSIISPMGVIPAMVSLEKGKP
jgi:hypothetical protein